MKRTMVFCLLFVLLLSAAAASADSVWTPIDDYFFETWQEKNGSSCQSVERQTFMAAGEDGFVVAMRTPVDQTPIATYPNGTEFEVSFFCGIGDNQWGTIRSVRFPGQRTFTQDWSGTSGYIAKKDLVQAYDSEAFSLLSSASITDFDASGFDACNTPFVIWSYPNSGVQLDVVGETMLKYFCYDYGAGSQYFPVKLGRLYTDPAGVRWVSVHLTKPVTDGWINLDHPMEGAIEQKY